MNGTQIKFVILKNNSMCANNGIFMNLPVKEYNMDEETGLKDEYVISFTPSHMEYIIEIHLNSEGKINQVYLVL